MSTLKERKQLVNTSDNSVDDTDSKNNTNNWGGYVSGVVQSILYNGIYILLGIGIIYASRTLNSETYLPTNINKPPYNPTSSTNFIKAFPYVTHSTGQGQIRTESLLLPFMSWLGPESSIGELFSKTIGSSMISARSIISNLLEIIQEIATPSADIERIFRMENLMVLLSPPILMLLLIVPVIPIMSFITSIKTYFTASSSIFIKILMLLPLYFVLLFLGMYQAVYPVLFDIYSVFKMGSNNDFKEYLKRFKILLYFGVSLALITPSFTNLKYYYSLGIMGIMLIPIILHLFKVI